MSGRLLYVVTEGTEITDDVLDAARDAGAAEVVQGVPVSLLDAVADVELPAVVEEPAEAEPDPDTEPDVEPDPVEPDTSAEDALIAAASAATTVVQLRDAVVTYAEAVKTGKA